MSQRIRNVVTAITLIAALFLAAPTPARAAPFTEGRLSFTGAWERAWSWLTELVFPGGGASQRRTARWEKEGGAINPDGWKKEGSMITPDGRTTPSPPPPSSVTTDEGGMINPDGVK